MKGFLILPPTQGPHPAVVFVRASGALDRNYWILHAELREHLTSHAIACLYWDRPGVGSSPGDETEQSFREQAQEALDVLRLLKARTDIDGKQVDLWRKSQGGWICPLAASLSSDMTFLRRPMTIG
jgi:pimeloyl-ACP methyl ester carboxylesterase